MGLETLALGSLGLSLGSTVASVLSGKEAAEEEQKAREQQAAGEKIQLAESRRQQIRQERVRRSQILQRAENLGVGKSSGETGAVGSLATQTAGALGFQFGQGKVAEAVTRSLSKASEASTDASTFAAVAGLSNTIFSQSGGFETIFKDTTKTS